MSTWSESFKKKFIPPEDIESVVAGLKQAGKTIATLNGSFDLLHAGHLEIIYQTSLQADIAVVALNTDASIKQYKGQNRPIIPLEFRLQMMAALEFVDYVTYFAELDPCLLLGKIRPHVHVNGCEYGENCIEANVVKAGGGRVHIVPLVAGLSTTSILQKLSTLFGESTSKCV